MLNLKNTLDGYLKNVEVIGNTIQDTNNLANIRSVGDKVEGQELYKIPVVSSGKNLFNKDTIIHNKTINVTTGIETASNEYHISNFIKINPNTRYIRSLGGGIFYYDKDFNFISMIDQTKNSPLNAMYCKLQVVNTWDLNVFQFEEGTQATPYEPYKENKLEILSPVQLEKVGDVADRIICKDGVWGVEKNITTTYLTSAERWGENTTDLGFKYFLNKTLLSTGIPNRKIICNTLSVNDSFDQSSLNNYNQILVHKSSAYSNYLYVALDVDSVEDFKKWLDDNPTYIKYETKSQFIALPHDQQVKLRTFAGQTNIAFLTEIPGQIKAQVPKSLGATVNTHTEQIADLHNSLDRVKKLEETTVSTVETGSSFTTVNATNNGYFEDVKLEGKTLVNLIKDGNIQKNLGKGNTTLAKYSYNRILDVDKTYTFICKVSNVEESGDNSPTISFNSGINGIGIRLNNGMNMFTFKNNVNLTSDNQLWIFYSNSSSVTSTNPCIDYVLILEGDHTNNPPSYFEGLMSVGQGVEEVSVASVNESLFDGNWELGMINTATGVKEVSNTSVCSGYINIRPSDSFVYYFDNPEFNTLPAKVVCFYDSNKNFIKGGNMTSINSIPENTSYCRIRTRKTDSSNITPTDIASIGKCVLSYKDTNVIHQSNKKPLLYYNPTTETWEKPILRQWDTIEKHSDGKYYYHKRSKEVVLNGSENWLGLNTSSELFNRMYISLPGKAYAIDNFVSDNFMFKSDNVANISGGGFAWGNINNDTLWFTFSKTLDSKSKWIEHLQANPTTMVYQLAQEEVYECTNIDLMTYNGETNYIINSGAISPKSLLKVHNNISNVVKILQEKVSLLENTFIAGLKSVLSGDMYSLATILYPEDFEQNDNTEQDIMVIPE
jgi:hypothetical protein